MFQSKKKIKIKFEKSDENKLKLNENKFELNESKFELVANRKQMSNQ